MIDTKIIELIKVESSIKTKVLQVVIKTYKECVFLFLGEMRATSGHEAA